MHELSGREIEDRHRVAAMSGDDDIGLRDGIVDERRFELAVGELNQDIADFRPHEVRERADARRLTPHDGRGRATPIIETNRRNDGAPIHVGRMS